jgi:hypothetical protein
LKEAGRVIGGFRCGKGVMDLMVDGKMRLLRNFLG